MRRKPILLVLALAMAAPAWPREAPRSLRLEVSGRPAAALGGAGAEVVRFGADVAASLLEGRADQPVLLEGWPTRPGERSSVLLERVDFYAPGARIVRPTAGGLEEVPRSRLAFFRGAVAGEPRARLLVTVNPETRRFEALLGAADGLWELRPVGRVDRGSHVLAASEELGPPARELETSCAQETSALESSMVARVMAGATTEPLVSLHTAVIAVDTDNELLALKFGDDDALAGDYVASLFAAMNVIYERDLNVRLLQGFTFLRTSDVADPYVQGPGGGGLVTGAQLNELAAHWSGGCGGACTSAPRALAMMLSGKQPSSFSSSGIASLGTLCSGGAGYSFSQVFKFSALGTVPNDVGIVAHEIGHNVGSPHTHCYPDPKPDTCWNLEGCYAGGVSCPAAAVYNGVNATGTLMSYCHLASALGVAGCSSAQVFHPTTVSLLDPFLNAAAGTCLFPAVAAGSLFAHGFETPPTSTLTPPWSGATP